MYVGLGSKKNTIINGFLVIRRLFCIIDHRKKNSKPLQSM